MRRTIHNTTAIAACLSLIIPSFAVAQETVPEDQVKQLEQQLEQKIEEGQKAAEEQLLPVPAEEPAPTAEAPAPEAVTEEPAAPETAPEAEAVVEPEAAAPAEVAAPEEAPAQSGEADQEAPASGAPVAPAEAVAPVEAAPEAAPAAEAPAIEEAPAEPEPAAEAAPAEVIEEAPQAEAATEAPAEAKEAVASEEKPAVSEEQATTGEAAVPETETNAVTAEPAQKAPAKKSLDAVVKEQGTAAGEGSAAAETGAAVQTEAAKEAASAVEASSVSALDDEASGEVTSSEVKESETRSSDEDFATSLKEALEADSNSQAAAQESSDDDDDHDLAKALLLGLGGVAVGAMLTNNRQVALSTPDRVVITRQDGSQEIVKDEVALLRQPGSTVSTENFDDGSSRTIVTREDGSKVVTIRDADLRVLRRTLVSADGQSTQLIDDTQAVEPVDIAALPAPVSDTYSDIQDEEALRNALMRQSDYDRRFTLGQIRNISEVRALVAPVNIDAITFETGSAAISSDQAQQLATLGNVIAGAVAENPQEIFLIEGHTDAVGAAEMNLALSDRRAESVALALTEYFDVPPENLVVQGYGEQFPKVKAEGDVRDNRRAAVRRITELLQGSN